MQSFNNELVRSLESLRDRRDNISSEIRRDEEKKNELEKYLAKLREELDELNGNIILKERVPRE